VRRLLPLVLFVVFWTFLIAGGRMNFFRDPGTFWHTVVGEKILAEGFIRHDPFTFTFAGDPWIPYQWLGEVVMALTHRVNGFHAQLALATGLIAGLLTHLTLRLIRTGLHPVACIMFMGVVLATASTHFHVRPHIATMIGMVLTMVVILKVGSGQWGWKSIAGLIPLYILWTSLHGGMLGGLTTLGLAGLGWAVLALCRRPTPTPNLPAILGLLGIGLLLGGTAFCSPYGVDMPRYWLYIMRMPHLPEIIVEHGPPDWSNPFTWPLAILAALYLFILAGTKPKHWRVSWLLPLFWMLQTYGRVRHAPLFALLASMAIADAWPHTRWATWLRAKRPDFDDPQNPWAKFLTLRERWLNVVGFALVIGGMVALQAKHSPLVAWAQFDPKTWPLEVLDVMREHEPKPGEPNRLFNDYTDGAVAIYFTPGYKVFVDDRCELFGDAWLVDFVKTGNAEPDVVKTRMAEWQKTYGNFHYALTRTDTPFDNYFANNIMWQRIATSATANFYVRK
jgi:hypothetical protein